MKLFRLILSCAILGWFAPLRGSEPLYVWADQLPLRKAPSADAAILETLPYGVSLEVLKEKSPRPYVEPIFAAFALSDGQVVMSRQVKPTTPGFSLRGKWVRVKSAKGIEGFVPSPWLLSLPPVLGEEESLAAYCERVFHRDEDVSKPGVKPAESEAKPATGGEDEASPEEEVTSTSQVFAKGVTREAQYGEMGGFERTHLPMLHSLEQAYVFSRVFHFRQMKPCLDPDESMYKLLAHTPARALSFRTNEVSSIDLTVDDEGVTLDWGWAD